MESVDFNDKYLDPPDSILRGNCDECDADCLVDNLNKVGTPGHYRWLCDDCLDMWNEGMISAAEDVLLANRQG